MFFFYILFHPDMSRYSLWPQTFFHISFHFNSPHFSPIPYSHTLPYNFAMLSYPEGDVLPNPLTSSAMSISWTMWINQGLGRILACFSLFCCFSVIAINTCLSRSAPVVISSSHPSQDYPRSANSQLMPGGQISPAQNQRMAKPMPDSIAKLQTCKQNGWFRVIMQNTPLLRQ